MRALLALLALGSVAAAQDAEVLVRRLGDESWQVRETASSGLLWRAEEARTHLVGACEDADPEVRARARRLLASMGGDEGLPPGPGRDLDDLVRDLECASWNVRDSASQELFRRGGETWPRLVAARRDPSIAVREQAWGVLVRLEAFVPEEFLRLLRECPTEAASVLDFPNMFATMEGGGGEDWPVPSIRFQSGGADLFLAPEDFIRLPEARAALEVIAGSATVALRRRARYLLDLLEARARCYDEATLTETSR